MSIFPFPYSGPIPPFTNVPIEPQWYKPRRFVIEDVTLGQTTTVTLTTAHDYVIGQLVRLIIPGAYGCIQLNETESYVIEIPADDQIVLALDSSQNVDPFIAATTTTKPETLPIGDINSGAINRHGRVHNKTHIPGSFINISPAIGNHG